MEHSSTNEPESTIEKLKSKNNTIKNYIESLDPLHYKALTISIRELESSFSLEKSIGYINYVNSLDAINHKNN
jgi:hypothetical protein